MQELRLKPGGAEKFVARFAELDVLPLAAEAADGGLLEAVMGQSDEAVVVGRGGIRGWHRGLARVAGACPSPERARVVLR